MSGVKLRGYLLGKPLYVYDVGFECEESDIEKYLDGVDRLAILRRLCECSAQEYSANIKSPGIQSVLGDGLPIADYIMIVAAWKALKYTDGSGQRKLSDDEFVHFMKMCFKVNENEGVRQTVDPDEMIFKVGYQQFPEQEDIFNLLARNFYLYFELWHTVAVAKDLDVLKAIEEIIGIPYDLAVAFGIALVGSKTGYTFPYPPENIDLFRKLFNRPIAPDSHLKFLEWCSQDYSYYKIYTGLMNPFIKFPFINTNEIPPGAKDKVFILCSYTNLYHKITSGIYFALCEKFNAGGKDNPFKEKYGMVFQEYVGVLLKEHLTDSEIIPEFKYKNGGQDSIDWFVYKDNKLLMIEVKQSSVYAKSKAISNLEGARADLKNTVIKGVEQLLRMRQDILSNMTSRKYPELDRFKHVKKIEGLVVVSDPLYNANLIARRLASEGITSPDLSRLRYNIINISQVETLLDNQSLANPIFEIVAYKSSSHKEMDFKEFNVQIFKGGKGRMTFLKKYYDRFFGNLGLPIKGDPPEYIEPLVR